MYIYIYIYIYIYMCVCVCVKCLVFNVRSINYKLNALRKEYYHKNKYLYIYIYLLYKIIYLSICLSSLQQNRFTFQNLYFHHSFCVFL